MPADLQEAPDPGKRSRTLLIAGVVVVLLAVGGALWYSHSQTHNEIEASL
jgi:hypothetical protein